MRLSIARRWRLLAHQSVRVECKIPQRQSNRLQPISVRLLDDIAPRLLPPRQLLKLVDFKNRQSERCSQITSEHRFSTTRVADNGYTQDH